MSTYNLIGGESQGLPESIRVLGVSLGGVSGGDAALVGLLRALGAAVATARPRAPAAHQQGERRLGAHLLGALALVSFGVVQFWKEGLLLINVTQVG